MTLTIEEDADIRKIVFEFGTTTPKELRSVILYSTNELMLSKAEKSSARTGSDQSVYYWQEFFEHDRLNGLYGHEFEGAVNPGIMCLGFYVARSIDMASNHDKPIQYEPHEMMAENGCTKTDHAGMRASHLF